MVVGIASVLAAFAMVAFVGRSLTAQAADQATVRAEQIADGGVTDGRVIVVADPGEQFVQVLRGSTVVASSANVAGLPPLAMPRPREHHPVQRPHGGRPVRRRLGGDGRPRWTANGGGRAQRRRYRRREARRCAGVADRRAPAPRRGRGRDLADGRQDAASGRGHARRGRADLLDRARPARADAVTRRRGRSVGADDEPDARPPATRTGTPASVHLRRLARAAVSRRRDPAACGGCARAPGQLDPPGVGRRGPCRGRPAAGPRGGSPGAGATGRARAAGPVRRGRPGRRRAGGGGPPPQHDVTRRRHAGRVDGSHPWATRGPRTARPQPHGQRDPPRARSDLARCWDIERARRPHGGR